MISLDGGEFTDAKVSRKITSILKTMFNGSWTTWKEVDKSARDELWAHFKAAGVQFEGADCTILKPYNPEWIKSKHWEDMIDRVWKTKKWLNKAVSGSKNRNTVKEVFLDYLQAAYNGAVVDKYGSDPANHPFYDDDLWKKCAGDDMKGGVFGWGSMSDPQYTLTGIPSTTRCTGASSSGSKDVQEELKEEVKVDLKEEMKVDLKEEMKADLKEEMKNELKEEMREELKEEMREELKEEMRAEIQDMLVDYGIKSRVTRQTKTKQGLMDRPDDVVFRIHYNGVFDYDPLRIKQFKVVEMQACITERVMFSQLLDIKKHAGNMSVEELVAWAEAEANSPYLRSLPLKSRPFRNDMKGKVLFTDMYSAKDEGFEMYPPLNDDEVGKDDLVLMCSNLENDCINDAAKILEDMSEGKNDASKSVEFNQGVHGSVDGVSEGMNDGANIDIDEQVLDKSFDYLSNGEDGVIELRKRRIQFKSNGAEVVDKVPDEVGDEEKATEVQQHTTLDVEKYGEINDNGLGLTPLIREHEKYMEALVRKLKGNVIGITDPFAIVEESNEIYLIYDDLTHWKLKKPKRLFLELLADDLELSNGNGLTLMSDQHKGLIEAVKDVMPHAKHRQCARHIYEGFMKQFSGVEFRGLFWAASKASYPQLFNKIMEKIKRANPKAH
ncbi:transposase, Ptta/En/Spm [Tanacetum coccineum]|uniref:Transposase, Ptta/En/Spm n=1 Tax=Tanacetum coccineum TaxID=301880 RepID=A0ABQ5A0T0_9ASTR